MLTGVLVFLLLPASKGNCERERKEKLKELQDAGSGALSLFVYLRYVDYIYIRAVRFTVF